MKDKSKPHQYAYKHRKIFKRRQRSINILNINAAVRSYSTTLNYSKFIDLLYKNNILINRSMLAHLAAFEPKTFHSLLVFITDAQSDN